MLALGGSPSSIEDIKIFSAAVGNVFATAAEGYTITASDTKIFAYLDGTFSFRYVYEYIGCLPRGLFADDTDGLPTDTGIYEIKIHRLRRWIFILGKANFKFNVYSMRMQFASL